jgi:hypothetical protein
MLFHPRFKVTGAILVSMVALVVATRSVNAQTTSPECLADLNKDGKVDLIDYSILVGQYFKNPMTNPVADLNKDGRVDLIDYSMLVTQFGKKCTASPTGTNPTGVNPTASHTPTKTPTKSPTTTPVSPSPTPVTQDPQAGESHALNTWGHHTGENPPPKSANIPDPRYDKCDDGTDIVTVHKMYHVIAYDGLKYPTWHPPVVNNPVTGVGKCYFGHEHGSDPQKYLYWNEIYQHFGKDVNGDGQITPIVINSQTGAITPGDRAGLPFGIANEKMDQYYNQENRDSIFVRHEDHVGHKIEYVNYERDLNTNIDGHTTKSAKEMAQVPNTKGLSIPYYNSSSNGPYQPTGVTCTHLHKFHQGTHSGDAILNNLHEVIFHSKCESVNINGINAPAYYPNNLVILTGMMAFGNPGEYVRFCYSDRKTKVCPLGKDSSGKCIVNDPLLSKLPPAVNSDTLGRNIVDRHCLENWSTYNPGNDHFGPYELWDGDLRILKPNGEMVAGHGRQWDVLDPIRFIDPTNPKGFSYNSENCAKGGAFDKIKSIGNCPNRTSNIPWNSPQSGFKGLKRTTYFGRNRIQNQGGPEIYWTDPLGSNAVTTEFSSGLKQRISPVNANIQSVQSRVKSLFDTSTAKHFLNDRSIQRRFNDGGGTVHAPN